MPATEQTWRSNQKLHVVFAISSLALLGATMWALVADHNRPWKVHTLAERDASVRLLDMQRMQKETVGYLQGLEQREAALVAAQAAPLDATLLTQFNQRVAALAQPLAEGMKPLVPSFDAAEVVAQNQKIAEGQADPAAAKKARDALLARLQAPISRVKFVETLTLTVKKTRGSERDAARSEYNLAIRDGLPEATEDERLKLMHDVQGDVDRYDLQIQKIKSARLELEALLVQLKSGEDAARKAVDVHKQEIERLHAARAQRSPTAGRTVMDSPILNAFNGPTRINQIWLPNLKIKFPLNDVARFDRCISCHAGIDKAIDGDPHQPAYPAQYAVTVTLTPQNVDAAGAKLEGERLTLENVYGMSFAKEALLNKRDTALVVFPKSRASEAGLRTADVIEQIGKQPAKSLELARRHLLEAVNWGQPLEVTVRRGLPQPLAAHPRLDLFGLDSSPHPFGKVGCTICHDGQGNGTTFQRAEHTPNTVGDQVKWIKDHNWASNHYWDWPQRPTRFIESSCLKCHHDVESLEPSPRFPDPPAPKLTEGYHLVRRFGCFGCHEVKGFNGPTQRIGPDLRVEPDYFAWGHAVERLVAPLVKQQQPAFDQAAAAEQKIATQRDRLDAQKKTATEAKNDARAKTLDEQLKPLDEQLTAATAKRLAASLTLDQLLEIDRLARKVEAVPDDGAARAKLRTLLAADADRKKQLTTLSERQKLLQQQLAKASETDKKTLAPELEQIEKTLAAQLPPVLSDELHAIAAKLADVETPGTYRKVGPSLRYVASKLDLSFLVDWIESPSRFRPSTRMPHVFGNFDHLSPEGKKTAERFEAVEIRGISEYLVAKSEPFQYVDPPKPAQGELLAIRTDEEKQQQIERGRLTFATRGCLSCHSIQAEGRPAADDDLIGKALAGPHHDPKDNQAPDLSKIGAKLTAGMATARDPQRWLYSWLKQPTKYHARTKMPDLFLDPIEHRDETGKVVPADSNKPVVGANGQPEKNADGSPKLQGKYVDPAADIAAYLLSLQGWQVKPVADVNGKDLDELAMMHLSKAFTDSLAKEYVKQGIPARLRGTLKGDEIELVAPGSAESSGAVDMNRQKLLYVGRRAISKYGCYGCHDIPGFEDAKPIGTGLADWGRKETDKLAFEQIVPYLAESHGHGAHGNGAHGNGAHGPSGHTHGAPAHGPAPARNEPLTGEAKRIADNREYFHHQVEHGSREGFLWQKLQAPRSYDFGQTETKSYNEWLRMPKFNFTDDETEAVMTFVLGLVADPPAPEYVYKPAPQQKAIVEGLKVLEKYNCGGCHVLQPERVSVKYLATQPGRPGSFPAADPYAGFESLRQEVTSAQAAESVKEDFVGRSHVALHGLPALQRDEAREFLLKEDGDVYDPAEPPEGKILRPLALWQNAVVDGQVRYVGQKSFNIDRTLIDPAHSHPAVGGDLARLIIPLAFKISKPVRNDLTGDGTWALVPPPLIGQGRKVQSAWMRDFLLDPYPIRPAVVLRMPRFNMSPEEANAVAAYFAAVDGVEFPYTFATSSHSQATASPRSADRREAALKVVAKVCTQCHLIGDFVPQGHPVAMAPSLDLIHKRLRPEYLRQWVSAPTSILPYTNMPVNFPHDKLVFQDTLTGSSREQIDDVVDLLMQYDQYMKTKAAISQMVPKTPAPGAAGPKDGKAAAPPAGDDKKNAEVQTPRPATPPAASGGG